MGNMSYCRFENTLCDLQECQDHMEDKLSETEQAARDELIETCRQIVEMADELAEAEA